MTRKIINEIVILGSIILGVFSVLITIVGIDFYRQDIQFHDTYFKPGALLLWLVIPLVISVYFIRGIKQSFKNELVNIILVVSLLLSCFILLNTFQMYNDFKVDLLLSKNETLSNESFIEKINETLLWTAGLAFILFVSAGVISIKMIRSVKKKSADSRNF